MNAISAFGYKRSAARIGPSDNSADWHEATRRRGLRATSPPDNILRFRIDRLLRCSEDELGEAAQRVIDTLGKFGPGRRHAYLALLADGIRRSGFPHIGPIANQVAAIEILEFFGSKIAAEFVEAGLGRPVDRYSIYFVSLTHNLQVPSDGESTRLAGSMVRLLDEAANKSVSDFSFSSLCAVAYKSLAFLSPRAALGPASRHLLKVESLELTAVLQAMVDAARRVGDPSLFSQEVTRCVSTLYGTYMQAHEDEVDNIPGVVARLLELLGRSGQSLDRQLDDIVSHPLGSQILYLCMQSGLDFIPPESRNCWYAAILKTLSREGQRDEFVETIQLIVRDESMHQSLPGILELVVTSSR